MKTTSKQKEEREVITCISLSPSNTNFTHSLSFTLMAKLKLEEGDKTTTTPKNKITTTPKLQISPLQNPNRGIYRHQGKGGQEDNPWPKARARPCPYGPENTAHAAFSRPCQGCARPAACYVWSFLSPVSWIFWFIDLMPWADRISFLRSMVTW